MEFNVKILEGFRLFIFFHDGRFELNKKITDQFLSTHETILSYYDDEKRKFVSYPMSEVKRFEIHVIDEKTHS